MFTFACFIGALACLTYRRQAPLPLTISALSFAAMVLASLLDWLTPQVLYPLLGSLQSGGFIIDHGLTLLWGLTSLLRAVAIGGLVFALISGFKIDWRKPGV